MCKTWTEELIVSEIKIVMNELEIERMPSHGEIVTSGRKSLAAAIRRTGGFKGYAEKLGLKNKFDTWDKEKIIQRLKEIMKELGLDRFPTTGEIDRFTGSYGLRATIYNKGTIQFKEELIKQGLVKSKADKIDVIKQYLIFSDGDILKEIQCKLNISKEESKELYEEAIKEAMSKKKTCNKCNEEDYSKELVTENIKNIDKVRNAINSLIGSKVSINLLDGSKATGKVLDASKSVFCLERGVNKLKESFQYKEVKKIVKVK